MKSPQNEKPKVVVVVGPTASGKSDLAVEIARAFNGEVISADSRQVYTGLDIGSGKITKREMRGIPHHLLDVAHPRRVYTAARFQKDARAALKKILSRGKLPIIAGGTGFYIDALLYDQPFPEVPPDPALRKKLAKKSPEELFRELKKKDPRRANEIDAHNKTRLIRALEIIAHTGKVPKHARKESVYDVLFIGIDWGDEKLKERIEKRLTTRMKRGMIAEAKHLHNPPAGGGLSWKRMEALGLEYRYLARFLQGALSKEEMLKKLSTEIWHYAKRQRTWFKRNKHIHWIDPQKPTQALTLVEAFLHS